MLLAKPGVFRSIIWTVTVREPQVTHCRTQVARIIASDLLSHSPALVRLFEYLAEKSLAGDAEFLKEYTIGVEALSKPSGYDPQADPSVRSQARRLRAKLAEYYEGEGSDDPTLVTLPKGAFQLHFERRPEIQALAAADIAARLEHWRRLVWVLAVAVVVLALVQAFDMFGDRFRQGTAPVNEQLFSPDMRALWRPHLESERPTIISLGIPVFVQFTRTPENASGPRSGIFRDTSLNAWPPEGDAALLDSWIAALNADSIAPRYNYMAVGEALAAYRLGKSLLAAGIDVPIVRSNALSWDEVRASNVIFLGSAKVNQHLRIDDSGRHFRVSGNGIENLSPEEGEPDLFRTVQTEIERRSAALVGRYPAQVGGGYATVIGSGMNLATWAAVEYLTQPHHAAELVSDLERRYGSVPEYFEVVVEARFRDEHPVEIRHAAIRRVSPH